MRIGPIGDSHGYLPALEAVLGACRLARCDLIVHCGDFLSTPFTPDPPENTIKLLCADEAGDVVDHDVIMDEIDTLLAKYPTSQQ
jgi:predicted phosphodiesterase